MGATRNEDHIELMVSYHAFDERVRLVRGYRELSWLGFELDNVIGIFHPKNLGQLLTFVTENPEYHIVSMVGVGRYANRFVPGSCCYRLAFGDKNSILFLNHLIDPNRHLIHEDKVSAALTMLNDVKYSNKG